MHGVGADGYDFTDIVPQLRLPSDLAIRFVFPHAPIMPVDYAGGMPMRAWFNLGADLSAPPDEFGIRSAQESIEQLIAKELLAGIPSRHIILAGFSQGGAMALQCGLRYPQPLGGILSLSGFLMLAETVSAEKHIANSNIPILLMHGTNDSLIPISFALRDYQFLTSIGFDATLKTYPMEHTVCAEEIIDISNWLQATIDASYSE